MLMTWQLLPTLWKSVCQSSGHGEQRAESQHEEDYAHGLDVLRDWCISVCCLSGRCWIVESNQVLTVQALGA